jgi:hypothetical protein
MRRALASKQLRFTLAVLLASSALLPRRARANGTFPAVSQLVSEPLNPSHMALRTTFGLVFSADAGANWSWICEDALRYTNSLPSVAVLQGGPVVLGVPTGVTVGQLTGCNFAAAKGVADNVVDLALVPKSQQGVLALGVDYVAHTSQLWESMDAGQSFVQLGERFPDFVATTLDAAPSNPDIIYISGMPLQGGAKGLLLRSEDHGKSFIPHEVPDSVGLAWPYIGAIDPESADKVYVRLADVPGRLKVTTDGGVSFSEPLRIDYEMQGFARSPDGKTVLVSSPAAGTFRADASNLQFEKVACSGVSCLLWNDAGLYACGDQSIDGYVVGRSRDGGASFERTLDFSCIRSDSACAQDTSVGSSCPLLWPPIEMQLAGFGACDPNASAPPVFNQCLAGGGQSGGAGSASGGASAGGGNGTGGTAGNIATSGGSGNGAGSGLGGRSAAGAAGEAHSGGAAARSDSGCSFASSASPRGAWLAFASLLVSCACRRRTRALQVREQRIRHR